MVGYTFHIFIKWGKVVGTRVPASVLCMVLSFAEIERKKIELQFYAYCSLPNAEHHKLCGNKKHRKSNKERQ
jgi:hypothetical protein